ncbi:MAG: hypothetical protein ABH850_03035 [Candidatus Micrarchaeota archaeon]
MDESVILNAGIIRNEEEIVGLSQSKFKTAEIDNKGNRKLKNYSGTLLLTNQRLLFIKKPSWFSNGLDIVFHCSLKDILSISTTGIISKKLNVNVQENQDIRKSEFNCANPTKVVELLNEAKQRFVEKEVIHAEKFIIHESKKEDSQELLKKKLAKGEISLEEFHQKIQRI